jgi:uncharacterized protein YdeI (YjbR/CyaY-like superfamily)
MEATEKKNPWDKSALWPEEMNLIKSIIAKTELVEMTKWGGPTYTMNGKSVVGVGGFKNYVAIWFFNGVFLKDAAKVLVSASETTKALRQWRFTSAGDIRKNESLLAAYIDEAIANEKAGLAVKPSKKAEVASEFFDAALKADAGFNKSFSALTPGKQREYREYIEDAKQEKTKVSRMEKIKPMVLLGIGLNDKYKK